MTTITRFILLLTTALLLAIPAQAQARLFGHVVGVVDGRTFILETDNGRITGAIQFVDVPEPEQPLSRLVREHFQRLVLGNAVTFVSNGFSPTALVGKLYLNGIDIGQQLVRDGAAWHTPPDQSGQNANDAAVYADLQALARVEKRGIWSIANLTPAWEFRSLQDKTLPDTSFVRAALENAAGEDARNYKQAKNNVDMWAEVGGEGFSGQHPAGNLFRGYDAVTKIRNVSTPSIAQLLVSGRKPLEVEVRAIYFQGEIKPRTSNTAFVLSILATSREQNFAKSSDLEFTADGKVIEVGSGERFYRESSLTVQELVQYRISRSDLRKLTEAAKATISAGAFTGTVCEELRQTIKQLIDTVK